MVEDFERLLFHAGQREITALDYEGALSPAEWKAFWNGLTPDRCDALREEYDAVCAEFEHLDLPEGLLALATVASMLRRENETLSADLRRQNHAAYERQPDRREKRREQARNGAQPTKLLDAETLRAATMALDARMRVINEAILDDVVKYAGAYVSLPTLARMLDRHPETLRSWRKAGAGPPAQRVGGQWVYDMAEVAVWIQQQRTKARTRA